MKIKTLLIFGILLLTTSISAQKIDNNVVTYDTTHVHLLLTNYGGVYEGRAIELDSNYILFLFNGDTLDFPINEVHHLALIDINIPESQLEKIPILGTERIFVGASGFSLKARQTEIRTVWFAFNSVDYGITDHITIGAVGATSFEFYYVGLKAKGSFDINNRVHAAVGAGWQYSFESFPTKDFYKYIYGALTFGNRERFFNISSGILQTGSDNYIYDTAPFLSLGTSWRLKQKWKLIAEYTFSPHEDIEEFNNLFVGASFFWKGPRLDFGFAFIPDIGIPLPVLSYAYVF